MKGILSALVLALFLGGCTGSSGTLGPPPGSSGTLGPPPGSSGTLGPPLGSHPCGAVFNAVRCLAMTDYAAAKLKVRREDIVAIDVLPEPTPEIRDGKIIVETRSGGPPVDVSVTLTDGSRHITSMDCGVGAPMACADEPQLFAGSVTGSSGGYRDVPCDGETLDNCATPVPIVDPAAAASAKPLTIARRDIPLDHVGEYQVRLGEATLPNGILTEASFDFMDDWPPDVTISDSIVWLEVRSLEPEGMPFNNIHTHGWRAGTERVEAVLVFTIQHVDPGAVLRIRDVVVR